jgi:hypothetical protein
MNIFMHLLFEEMKELWQGVDAYDSYLECHFNLHSDYLWSIHDYLAYAKLDDWCVHGPLNCPICMDDTDAFRLEHGRKVSFFDCHRRFLASNHEFRNDTWSFLKGKTIRKGPPKQKFGTTIIQKLDDLKETENGVFEGYGAFLMCQQRECTNNVVSCSERCSVEQAVNFSMEGYRCWSYKCTLCHR